ncbi:KEOPS complex subunit Pcc1 [Halalkalirubrum salinum]|uniref:KEOPS complex subunit Pcc1 n=1 Tax=Halalkalirubrum salinum TaxID=2563889 RepID=UPI0010FB46EF|nr:KEOPS complex subunit Pcc1 [Halalkalirubrum salinum]
MDCADHTASLSFSYDSAELAAIVADAVSVEVGEIDDDRATATVDREDTTVIVHVSATDFIALRAGTNSWTRLVSVAESIVNGSKTPETAE